MSSRTVNVRRVPETTYNTTPTNSTNWLKYCLNDETLGGAPQTTVTGKQCPGTTSRMPQQSNISQVDSGGVINTELSAGDYDDIMEAAMGGTWSGDSLTVGSTLRSYSLEKEFTLQTKFLQMTGQRVAGFSVGIAAGSPAVTFGHTFLGSNVTADQTTSLVGTGSEAAESGENSMSPVSLSGVEIDGAGVSMGETTAVFTTMNMNLDNSLFAKFGVGQTTPYGVSVNDAVFTGQIAGFLTGDVGWDMYERALANSDFDIKYTITENSKSYTFDFPKVRLTGQAPRIEGRNSELRFDFTWQAIQTAPIITRVP